MYLRLLVCRAVPSVAGCPVARCPWSTPRVLQYVIMSCGAVSLVDPACITIRDYVFHCADLHIRYARVTVGSQVLSLSHKSKPSKFYALSLRLGSLRLQAEATPMQILCSQLREPCTRAIQHNMSIVTHISKKTACTEACHNAEACHRQASACAVKQVRPKAALACN